MNTRGQQSLPRTAARPETTLEVLAAAGRVGERTVDIVAVIEVLILQRRTSRHQLLQPHLSDEEAA